MVVVAFVAVTWTWRIEHQRVLSRLNVVDAELASTKDQLHKTEYALLLEMRDSIAKKPEPFSKHGIAKEIAERIAINRPNNNYIWWVLTRTNGLSDGMTLADAETILGPATDKSDPEFVYWYDSGGDDPEKLRATRHEDKLAQWITGRNFNFKGPPDAKSLH